MRTQVSEVIDVGNEALRPAAINLLRTVLPAQAAAVEWLALRQRHTRIFHVLHKSMIVNRLLIRQVGEGHLKQLSVVWDRSGVVRLRLFLACMLVSLARRMFFRASMAKRSRHETAEPRSKGGSAQNGQGLLRGNITASSTLSENETEQLPISNPMGMFSVLQVLCHRVGPQPAP